MALIWTEIKLYQQIQNLQVLGFYCWEVKVFILLRGGATTQKNKRHKCRLDLNIKFHQNWPNSFKTIDKDISLTYARCVVSSKHPGIRADALDFSAELIQCHTAVVTATSLVQTRDDKHHTWTMVLTCLNVTQNLCSDIWVPTLPILCGFRPYISTCWIIAIHILYKVRISMAFLTILK